ncbi:hypothetical protein KFK09_011960 [Dendrobium nobile]|uniref:Uncharacterized protein n=1 Tax=Dendrobium nobile TaxID=94219 RepID=A0A8T3BHF1_DENNO|nr:hypothetical protein KFK09_011960 [Dendrobium nobile]
MKESRRLLLLLAILPFFPTFLYHISATSPEYSASAGRRLSLRNPACPGWSKSIFLSLPAPPPPPPSWCLRPPSGEYGEDKRGVPTGANPLHN